jgi:hypothetical protein
MNIGDLVRCWSINEYSRVGILLEHNKVLKTAKIFFQDTGEIIELYSRDVELLKRAPNNVRKLKEKVLDKS